LAASIQTAEIPDQVRNDGIGVDALARGCVDAMQVSATPKFFMPAEPASERSERLQEDMRSAYPGAPKALIKQELSPQATPFTDQRSGIGAV
jgi:hypothetical protein